MNNQIHPTAIIEGDVEFGSDNHIDAYCILRGPLKIGSGNRIFPFVTIGTPGEDTRNPHYDSSKSPISIGDNNIIREYTAIQKPCYEEETKIENNVFIMHGVHIPHDAIISDDSVITPGVILGGMVRVLKGANLAIGAKVSQRVVIGQYSIAAMGGSVLKNIKPFSRFIPGKPISVNYYAIEKFGFEDCIVEIENYVLRDLSPPAESRLHQIISEYKEKTKIYNIDEYQ
tara:strand:- start:47 stop:733 length:687 start_codon:yes stop_codon:yes gene_type:complete